MFNLFLVLLFLPNIVSLEQSLQSQAKALINDPEGIEELFAKHKLQGGAYGDGKSVGKSSLEMLLQDIHADSVLSTPTDVMPQKHVLTILTDDQGWGDIGYNDHTFVTPVIDFLAGNGVKFDNFYVQATCTPTRSSLLTGRYTVHTGLQDGPIIPGERRSLPLDLKTFGHYFQDGGYATNYIGKWHLGQELEEMLPHHRGYDYFFGNSGGAIDHYSKEIGMGCGSNESKGLGIMADACSFYNAYDLMENGVPYIDQETYSSDLLATKAVEAIRRHSRESNKPMMMHFNTNAPHTPVQAPPALLQICGEGVSDGHDWMVRSHFRKRMCAMVLSIDIAVLKVVLALVETDMFKSTLILFHSDNGGLRQAGSVNFPYREGKGSLFEGGIHVPAFMYGHGLHSSYARLSHRKDLVHVSDVLPTLMGYAGILTKEVMKSAHFDGHNHWDQLVLGRPLQRNRVPLNAASLKVGFFSGYIQIVNGVTWKFMFNPNVLQFTFHANNASVRYQLEGEFLYNLSEDPYEETNLVPYANHFEHPNLYAMEMLNLLRFETLVYRATSVPSQLKEVPPPLPVHPSPLGCWLPRDSPLYYTFNCPPPAPVIPGDVYHIVNASAGEMPLEDVDSLAARGHHESLDAQVIDISSSAAVGVV